MIIADARWPSSRVLHIFMLIMVFAECGKSIEEGVKSELFLLNLLLNLEVKVCKIA